MKKKLLSILFGLGIVGTFLSAPGLIMGAVLPQTVGVFETSLSSPITTSATTMTLTANAVRGGTTLSGYNCFTVDQGSAQSEFICGTVSGTTVSSLVRGIDPSTGTSTVTSLQFAHRRGASVKITDFPAIVIMRHQLNGSDTIGGLIRYDTTALIGVGTPTSTLATKYYVDNTASAGAATADETTKGLAELSTAREAASSTLLGGSGGPVVLRAAYATDTPLSGCAVGFTSTPGAGCVPVARLDGKISANFIATTSAYNWSGAQTFNTATTTFNSTSTFNGITFGANVYAQYRASTTIAANTTPVPVFVATSTNAIWPSNASIATTSDFLGFATSSNLTNGATGTVQIDGVVGGFSGLTQGLAYYVQNTAGTIGTSMGTAELYVGRAISSTQILLDRQDGYWQYLGSQSCSVANGSCTVNAPMFSRHGIAVISITGTSGGFSRTAGWTLNVEKVGATSVSASASPGTDNAHNPSGTFSTNVSWVAATGVVTISNTNDSSGPNSVSQTIYFYR